MKPKPMGSFEDYDWIRGALVWLGCADPADTRAEILDNDPRRDELVEVMELWEKEIGTNDRVEVGDIPNRSEALADRLRDVACRGVWSSKSVGWWLRRHKDRAVGGRAFKCAPGRNGQGWWLAVKTTDGQADLWTDGTQGPLPEWMAAGISEG
jgi:hypothetical protein